MSKAAIMAQEQERAQVGRELHDNVNQVLTTVKLYNELCLDAHPDQHLLLGKSVNYLNDCINEIRTISKRLSTPTLGAISFEDSIKELINSLQLTDKVMIHLTVNQLPKNLSQEIHLSIYRIVQEHMTNVFKHAEAEQVHLCFSCYADAITVSIKDDGKGFNMKAKRNGIGISNMIGRAESLNGKLQIHSTPGKGCQLQLSIPLV